MKNKILRKIEFEEFTSMLNRQKQAQRHEYVIKGWCEL